MDLRNHRRTLVVELRAEKVLHFYSTLGVFILSYDGFEEVMDSLPSWLPFKDTDVRKKFEKFASRPPEKNYCATYYLCFGSQANY